MPGLGLLPQLFDVTGSCLSSIDFYEAEPATERSVPRKVAIGRERDGRKSQSPAILDGSFYQSGTNALPLVRLSDGDLGEVETVVQAVGGEEAHRLVPFVGSHPQCSVPTKLGQDGSIHRVAIGKPGQSHAPEDGCGRALDGCELFQVLRPGKADRYGGSAHSTV